jgi:hypothetical protein
MFANNYISTIVENQLPEFIRADHPTFVLLLKKYYEYMEQTNKTLDVGKNLYDYMDVDTTRADLIKYFKSKIIPNFPEETELSTEKLIKAAKFFYSKKGSADSFKFIFRTLYGQEVEVYFPKEDILKASDGKWKLPKAIRLSFYDKSALIPGGNVNVFAVTANTINSNGINFVTKDVTVNSYIRIGDTRRKVVYVNTAGDYIKVDLPFPNVKDVDGAVVNQTFDSVRIYKVELSEYSNFNVKLLEKRRGIGEISRTTCVIEKAILTVDGETGREFVELYISNIFKLFDPGENLVVEYEDENGISRTFKSKIISLISNIKLYKNRFNVVQTGRKYFTGDPVVIYGGLNDSVDAVKAIAVVNNVSLGSIESITVAEPGYLFRDDPNSLVRVLSNTGVGANIQISGIWEDGANSETFNFNTDAIEFKTDIALNTTQYDFDNVTTFINLTAGFGNTTTSVNLNTATYTASTVNDYYKSFIVKIISGTGSDGSGTKINSAVITAYNGTSNVASWGTTKSITGTVNVTSGSTGVVGNTTVSHETQFVDGSIPGFYTYLAAGKDIEIAGETRTIATVTNNHHLTVTSAFTTSASNVKLNANSTLTTAPDSTSNCLLSVGFDTTLGSAFSYETIRLGKVRFLDLEDGGSFFEEPPTFDAISMHDTDYSLDEGFLVIPKGQFSNYNREGTPPSIRLASGNAVYSLANGYYTGTRLFIDVGDTSHFSTVVDYIVTDPGSSANVKTVYLDRVFENNIDSTTILNKSLFFDFRPNVRGTGKIGTLLLKKGGTGYSVTDNVEFVGTGYGANAYLTVSSGVITGITLDNRGEGYPAVPSIIIKNGSAVSSGTGAEFQIYLLSDGESFAAETSDIGRIQNFRMINRGFDYANTPFVSLRVADILTDNLAAGKVIIEGDSVWQGGATNSGATFQAIVDGAFRADATNTVIRVFNYSGSLNTQLPIKVATQAGNLTLNVSTQNANISFNNTNEIKNRKYPVYYGDGSAKANAEFSNGLINYDGFYLNTDGFISADKKLQNKDYYHNFSYEIESETSLDDYKETVNRVAHPAGLQLLSRYLAKDILLTGNDTKSNLHSSNSAQTTNANTSFASNVFYGNSASLFSTTTAVGDIVIINTSTTAQNRKYSRLVTRVVNGTTLWLEEPIGGLGDGKIRTTAACNEIIVFSNSSAITESLIAGDDIRFNISSTIYDREVVSISGNTITLNTTVPAAANVLYNKIPSYNVVGFDIIKTNG